jgi:hypothetical protein
MIGGEWKRPERDRQSPLLVRFRLYRIPVGVIPGLILFRLVAFWGRSTMGWVRPFFVGRVFSWRIASGLSVTKSRVFAPGRLQFLSVSWRFIETSDLADELIMTTCSSPRTACQYGDLDISPLAGAKAQSDWA